jgi:uncharacterized protein (TIGR03118 family)
MIRVCFQNFAVVALATAVLAPGCDDDDDEVVVVPPGPGSGGSGDTQTIFGFQATTLVTNQNDADLINAWGLVADRGAFWIANAGTGRVSVYDGNGRATQFQTGHFALGEGITGVARVASTTDVAPLPFLIPCANNPAMLPTQLIFASEEGLLIAINDQSPVTGVRVVDRSSLGANYKGVARLDMASGPVVLAADFVNRRIDVFDAKFQLIQLAAGAFTDPQMPADWGPFNIATINGRVYMMEAMIGEEGDEVRGPGLGAIAVFDANGALLARIQSSLFNAPWGLTFADPSSTLTDAAPTFFVGNFGDGRITRLAGDGTYRQIDQLTDLDRNVLAIDGLWGLEVGNANGGSPNALYFAAGPNDEADGAYGRIDRVSRTVPTGY